MSVLTLEAKLERTESSTTWGFRLGGGKDFSAPLTIQRVDVGSLAAKCGLQVGDIILRIGNTQTEQLKHKEAKDNIMRCGNRLDLLLQRGGDGGYASFNSPQINTNWNNPAAPPAMSPAMSQPAPAPYSAPAPSSAPQNFNNAPRPFGTSPAPPRGYEVNLSLQTQNMNMGGGAPPSPAASYGAPSAPAHAPAPAYKPAPSPAYQPSMPSPAPSASSAMSKPWSPAPSVVSNASPRPFGGGAPPKPTGQGATRGKRGDAAMNTAALPSGRIPVCAGCNAPIRGPFVTALGKCWCPDHFTCANPQCGIKLLDIGFVEEGGFLYCEKDYATMFAPHCDKCGKAVVGECVNALQKSFHPECFLCAQCSQPIGGTKFHIEDGKFYCERDWASMFQTMCAGCDFPIEPGDRWVEAMGKNFHSECFNCSTCQVNLEGQQFCAKAGKPYCKKHAR